MQADNWTRRDLYGGAITCEIPSDWRDVSDIRQVPDHQECWQQQGPEGAVLVVEILEREQSVSDENAATYFFRDLAEANGAVLPQDGSFSNFPVSGDDNEELKKTKRLPADSRIVSGVGCQKVAMGRDTDIAGNPRQQEIRWIQVNLAAIRLPSQGTDLLVTLSVPLGSVRGPDDFPKKFDERFIRLLSSMNIQDWSLFG